jgi:hypothetical protein
MVTPAFTAIPLMRGLGRRLEHPAARRLLDAAVLASAGLILTSAEPLARASIHTSFRAVVAVTAFMLVSLTRLPTVWIIAASAAAGALVAVLR